MYGILIQMLLTIYYITDLKPSLFIFSIQFPKMMQFPDTKHPIHPIYQAFCDDHKIQLAAAFQLMGIGGVTSEKQYEVITELRAAADEFAKKVPVPETLQSKQEVMGGPKHLKIGTTVFRPVGTENEVLPVILFWYVILHCL